MAVVSALVFLVHLGAGAFAGDDWVWWEGERPERTNFKRKTWFNPADDREREKLSAGAWITHDGTRAGPELFAEYRGRAPGTADYHLWTRKFWKHGPFRWRFDKDAWRTCGRDVALADSVSLRRHVGANWVYLGRVRLGAGTHRFEVRLLAGPGEKAVACFDAFLLTPHPFQPRGKLKPGEASGRAAPGWWAFEPALDGFGASDLDLRRLNEPVAGEGGFVARKGASFVLGNGRPVRFWAVNCGPGLVRMDPGSVDYLARRLAKLGVNLVRFHGPIFDRGAADPTRVDRELLDRLHYFVAALKRQGIYTALSFYFPLWFTIRPGFGIPGYEEAKDRKPFALLFFDERMQAIYRAWAKVLLTTENPYTKTPLAREPAVALVEIVNEDSYFFWTFKPKAIPGACRRGLERAFGKWLERRHGSIRRAFARWGFLSRLPGDRPAEGRMALFDAWHMTRDGVKKSGRSRRIRDQVRFLAEHQRAFYAATIDYFRRDLGLKSLVSCSNWTTADPVLLDALERWTYTAGEVIDQHGYFGGPHRGPSASYRLNVGDTFRDRAGVREPWALPVRVQTVSGHPQILSEIGWPSPNRFKAEFPFLAATYCALQGVDGICFFAAHGAFWEAEPEKFPLAVPTILGQFPAAALAYRRGDIQEADAVFEEALDLEDLFALKGSAAVSEQNLDQLRAGDVPSGQMTGDEAGTALHPLAFYVGRVERRFAAGGKSIRRDLGRFIAPKTKTVQSLTGELGWNWNAGVATVNTARCQGATGFLARAGRIELGDVVIESENEYATVLVVALDDRPIASASKILIQAVTEDRPFGWTVEGEKITALGGYPVNVRDITGTITLKRVATGSTVQPLDPNGYARGQPGTLGKDRRVRLARDALYTLVTRPTGR